MKRSLGYDSVTKTGTVFHSNDNQEQYVVTVEQDVQEVIDSNQAQYAQSKIHDQHGEFTKYASIPITVLMELQASGKIEDQAYMRKWLNDRANLKFRTRPGRV